MARKPKSIAPWKESLSPVLPQTPEEFEIWCDQLLERYGFQLTNANRHVVAEAVLHLKPEETFADDEYFAKKVSRRIANDAAFRNIQKYVREAKEEQERLKQEAAAKKVVDAIAVDNSAPPGTPQVALPSGSQQSLGENQAVTPENQAQAANETNPGV